MVKAIKGHELELLSILHWIFSNNHSNLGLLIGFGSLAKRPILSLQYLEQCDEVVFMQDGRVAETGTHADLMARDGGEGQYANMLSFDQGLLDRDTGSA